MNSTFFGILLGVILLMWCMVVELGSLKARVISTELVTHTIMRNLYADFSQ